MSKSAQHSIECIRDLEENLGWNNIVIFLEFHSLMERTLQRWIPIMLFALLLVPLVNGPQTINLNFSEPRFSRL